MESSAPFTRTASSACFDRRFLALWVISLFAAILLVAGGAVGSGQAAVSRSLIAGFDSEGNIYLTFADGTKIGAQAAPGTVIPVGTYTITLDNNGVDDQGNKHQYHLFGPGVNLTAGSALQATWTATFKAASTYVYQDDLNPTTLHEVFGTPGSGATSTAASGSTTTASSPAPSAVAIPVFRGTLQGAVDAAGKLTLVEKGKTVSSLKAGRYTIVVTDSSTKGGFTIKGTNKAAIVLSGTSFEGKHSVTIKLTAGRWFFYARPGATRSYLTVAA